MEPAHSKNMYIIKPPKHFHSSVEIYLRVHNVQAKSSIYKGLVRPTLEYCCSVWDPHHKNQDYQLEIIQRRAARFVLRRYHNTSSVTNMLQQLNRESLWQRRAKRRLTRFIKANTLKIVVLPFPNVVQLPIRPRPRYPHAFQVPYCSTDAYKFSFFPRTVVQWNNLPASITMAPSLQGRAGTTLRLITSAHAQCTLLPQPPPFFFLFLVEKLVLHGRSIISLCEHYQLARWWQYYKECNSGV